MESRRTDRVAHLIQMELGRLILTKVKDPRLGFVTVTHVDISADLKSARVFYSVMGGPKVKDATRLALENAAGFLQREIASVIRLRYTPKLVFRLDDSLDQSMEIDRLIRDVQKEKSDGLRPQ